jgi:hypothetical protein
MARRLDTLFYEIRAETGQFERGLKGVGTELDKLGTFIKGKPLIAAGALASSLALVAYQATQMAAAVDKGVKAATASMPSLVTRTGELRKEIEALSRVSGRSQVELSEAFSIAAKTGVESFSQLQQVVQTAVSIADATGEDLAGVIGGLDLALDGFGLSATRAKDAGAKLFAVAQGRFGFTELTGAIQPIVPILASAGVSFEVMTAALGNLLDEGKSPKQAAKQLKEMADEGKAGAEKIRELAGEVITSADAMERLQAAATLSREDAGKLGDILRENLNAELINLGNQILPAAIAGMKELVGWIQTYNQFRGKTSFFAGQELALPDTVPQLATFAAQRAKEAEALSAKVKLAIEDLRDAEVEYAKLPQGARDLGGTSALEGKKQALKLLRDELTQVSQAAVQAAAKINDIANPRKPSPGSQCADTPAKSGDAERVAKRAAEALQSLRDDAEDALAAVGGEFLAGFTALTRDLEERILEAGRAGKLAEAEAIALAESIKAKFFDSNLQKLQEDIDADFQKGQARRAEERAARDKQIADFRVTATENVNKAFEETLAQLDEASRKDRARLELNKQIGREVANVATGFVDLLGASGAFDDQMRDTLANTISVGVSIKEFATEYSNLTSGKLDAGGKPLGSTLGALSAAVPVLSGLAGLIPQVASLFGDSPALKAAKAATEKNTVALDRLREEGLFGTSRAGGSFTAEAERLDGVAGRDFGTGGSGFDRTKRVGSVATALNAAGFTLDELNKLAEDVGLTLPELSPDTVDQFIIGLRQIVTGLEDADITGFTNDFAGGLDRLRLTFAVKGTDAQGQFDDLVTLLTGPNGAKGVFDSLAGIDITKVEGAAKAREILLGIFDSFETLDKEALGGLNPEQFRESIQELLGVLPSFNELAKVTKSAAEIVDEFFGALGRSFRVFDTSGVDQATQVLDGLAKFSPAIAAIVAQGGSVEEVTAALQAFYGELVSGEATLEGTGLTIDMLVDAIDRLQGVSADAARQAEQAAADEARAAEQAARDAEQAAKDQARAAQEAADAQERYTEALLRATEAIGEQALRQLQDEFTLFDISDPVEQLRQFAEALKAGSPVFASLIGGANVADPNARNDLLTQLKAFFLANPEGVAGGFFSADTQRSALLDLAQQLKAANAVEITGGTNSSFGIDRSITEITGSRIGGLLGSILIVEQQQLAELQAIRAVLAPSSISPLLPPSLPSSVAAAGGGGTVVVSIGTLNLGAIAGAAGGLPDIATLTVAISQEIARQINLARNGA